ncbi:hypothetical protein EV363DRAFT_1356905 [Boletus edulis]|nr:hypothetical protein EV363DRAFT_1356905 [Boletus edulis]
MYAHNERRTAGYLMFFLLPRCLAQNLLQIIVFLRHALPSKFLPMRSPIIALMLVSSWTILRPSSPQQNLSWQEWSTCYTRTRPASSQK